VDLVTKQPDEQTSLAAPAMPRRKSISVDLASAWSIARAFALPRRPATSLATPPSTMRRVVIIG
jgi:hypothetical protein